MQMPALCQAYRYNLYDTPDIGRERFAYHTEFLFRTYTPNRIYITLNREYVISKRNDTRGKHYITINI